MTMLNCLIGRCQYEETITPMTQFVFQMCPRCKGQKYPPRYLSEMEESLCAMIPIMADGFRQLGISTREAIDAFARFGMNDDPA